MLCRPAFAVVALSLAACSPADHAYYARGKVAEAVNDGFAAASAYDRYLKEHKAHPASPADIGLAARPGTSVGRDRIVLVLAESRLPTGKFDLAGKPLTFVAKEEGGRRVWTCLGGDLQKIVLPENCR